ncbi:MAG: cyclic nucleotide-binding domain-containing protein, partial [Pyrinomonadaceae bacterium]|nr:cyclic nucleotide-binding domain-containing protein [Pyrinomonadaceae bacterium]
FLGHLSASDRQAFDSLRSRRYFSKDEEIFHVGQPPEFLYVLHRGRVALMHEDSEIDAMFTSPNGSEKIFGAVEAFSECPFDSTLKALSLCEFDVVDKAAFFNFLLSQPAACLQMTIMISNRYHQSVLILDSK